jgi:TPR repeat protein
MYQLALAYSAGLPGVPANLERAEALAHRAVDHGMLRSLFVLSKLYQARGDGQKAQQYLARAIDAGDPKAIIMSAQSYMFGSSPDFAKAVDLMRRGALLGDRRCMTEFATALEMQLGGQKRDAVLEQRLLRRAISLGDRNAEAEWALGQVNGSYGIGVDKPTGLAKLQRLAGAGVPGAEMDLGGLLLKGKHVKQDEQAGIALVRQAARHGNPMAKLVLEKRGLAEKQR